MTLTPPSTRRDPRFNLKRGSSIVELDDPAGSGQSIEGVLTRVSAAGLAFETAAAPVAYIPGRSLGSLAVRVGECALRGEAVVRNIRNLGQGQIEVGCLFYPDVEDEDRWMTLLAGIEVALAAIGDDS
ncbi:MAG: hypothetical protein GY716_23655 [bacterium]|nr:hypothetical protein [bacterium]